MTAVRKPKKIVSYDTNQERPTETAYACLQRAYDWFNRELWDGKLPQCLITFQRHKAAYGYYSPKRFARLAADDVSTDEIALNPQHFAGRPTEETISTLVHEMVHLWQQHHGKPPRKCYHDKQWAGEMKRVGLYPSSTGEPGGKETGQRCSHYIIADGPFQRAYQRWIATEQPALYADVGMILKSEKDKEKPKSKIKYSCPDCDVNAWGKPKLHIICGECEKRLEPEVDEDQKD